MSENAVYSCPSCGALSKVDPAAGDGSLCRECGFQFQQSARVAPKIASPQVGRRFIQRDVVSRRRQVERERSVLPTERGGLAEIDTIEDEPSATGEDEVVSDDGHRRVVRRKKRRRRQSVMRPVWLGLLWVGVVVAALLVLRHRMENSKSVATPSTREEEQARRAAEIQIFIDKHMDACRDVLGQFWGAPMDQAVKALFVYDSQRVTPAMYRYSQQHGFLVPSGEVRLIGKSLVAVDDVRAIETVWEDADDRRFEVVFLREGQKWKIDWEAYVRYSSTRWDVFVSGAVRGEGDFRLYMREKRLADIDGGKHIGLKFYPAHYEAKTRRKGESPTVLVPVRSELGARVEEVLKGLDEEVELGDPALRVSDPRDMARVRVVLEWRETLDDERFLQLKELKAGSWYAEDVAAKLEAMADDGSKTDDNAPEEVEEPAPDESDGDP